MARRRMTGPGLEYWASEASDPSRLHYQGKSFNKALHKAVEESARSGRQINVYQYEKRRSGMWGETGEEWRVKVT